jgi:hypothetical protein
MSAFPHDNFAKVYFGDLLPLMGILQPNPPLKPEGWEADMFFKLGPDADANRHQLGLLGQLLTRDCLIEVFRNPATLMEIRTCQGKLAVLEGELHRQAKQRNNTVKEPDLPELWLIMPTASKAVRQGFGAIATAHPGVYSFPIHQRTRLIVVHQLVESDATLLLRILGRSRKQQRAIEAFTARPAGLPLPELVHASIEERLADYRANLASRSPLTPEDQELIMNLSALYQKQCDEWKQEGIQVGMQQGMQQGRQAAKQELALNLLREGESVERVARLSGLPLDTVQHLLLSLSQDGNG